MRLRERVVLVTGASRGVGRATAVALVAAGARVLVTARTMEPSDRLAGSLSETVRAIESAGGSAFPIVADLSDPDDVLRLAADAVAWQGRVDVIVNNAAFLGKAAYHDLDDLSLRNWERQLAVNVTAPFLLTKALVPQMRARGSGAVVNLTSATGDYHEGAVPGFAYGTTKAAVNRMTIGLARELRADGIAVFGVEPGYVRTEIAEQAAAASHMDIDTAHAPEVPAGVIVELLQREPDEVSGCIFSTVAGRPPLLRYDGRLTNPTH